MQLDVIQTGLKEVEADALVLGHWSGAPFGGDLAEVDILLNGAISELAGIDANAEISGKRGELILLHTRGAIAAKRVLVVGLGKRPEADNILLQEASGTAVRFLREKNLTNIASALHRSHRLRGKGSKDAGPDPVKSAEAAVDGAFTAIWEPGSHKTEKSGNSSAERFIVVEPDEGRLEAVTNGAERGRILAESANLARTLVNAPPNDLAPMALADQARAMAGEVGLGCDILDEDAMLRLGMGSLLAVSAGSENRARLVILKHTPLPNGPAVAFVGKGITFDTGGISIKAREGMEAMKGDMAGAAAVIAAMRAIVLLGLPVNVVGVAPCAENMLSGKAYRPADVVRCMNGKTVEIISTDAEGRMVLADALTYAVRNLGAPRVVDVATLTGACVIALGHACSGAMTNDRPLLEMVRRAAERAGEKIWELPLFSEYKTQIKSEIADLKNSGGRPAGAITAGMFLREFTGEVPWVHLDIAGTSSTHESRPHLAKGPTGVMVRTLVELASELSQ